MNVRVNVSAVRSILNETRLGFLPSIIKPLACLATSSLMATTGLAFISSTVPLLNAKNVSVCPVASPGVNLFNSSRSSIEKVTVIIVESVCVDSPPVS